MSSPLRPDSGFTLIELLVSMTILIVGVFGLVTSVDASRKLSDVTEHESIASQVADRELTTALALPFNAVALTSKPTATVNASDDATMWNSVYPTVVPVVTGGNDCVSAIDETKADNEGGSSSCLVVCQSTDAATTVGCTDTSPGTVKGRIPPIGSVTIPSGVGGSSSFVKYKIYRYVTWVNDMACGASCASPCTSNCGTASASSNWRGDYKRITIALEAVQGGSNTTGGVTTQFGQGPTKPIVVSAIKRDPSKGVGNAPGDTSGCGVYFTC